MNAKIDYLDQYRDLEFFHKEYVGEEILSLFGTSSDMKNIYLIPVNDLRFQIGVIIPKRQLFEESRVDPANARLFIIPTRHRENIMVKKIIKLKTFNMTTLSLKKFMKKYGLMD